MAQQHFTIKKCIFIIRLKTRAQHIRMDSNCKSQIIFNHRKHTRKHKLCTVKSKRSSNGRLWCHRDILFLPHWDRIEKQAKAPNCKYLNRTCQMEIQIKNENLPFVIQESNIQSNHKIQHEFYKLINNNR